MRVNNLIERKNKREAVRNGQALPANATNTSGFTSKSRASRFSRVSRKSKKSNLKTKAKQSTFKPSSDLTDTKTRKAGDSSEDEFSGAKRERQVLQDLEELDLKYLVNEDEDEDLLFQRGNKKQTAKQNESLQPLTSPFIP